MDGMTRETVTCPRCKATIERAAWTSRLDGVTPICGLCATRETQWVFEHPDGSLPSIDNPIPVDV